MPKPVVFISHTSDLQDDCQAVIKSLRPTYEPYGYQEDRSRRTSPETHCRQEIERANVFIAVLGKSFGSRYSETDDRSIVQWEFDTAADDPEKEILTFLRSYPPNTPIDPQQQKFIGEVSDFRNGVWCQEYSTAAELIQKVSLSLTKWLAEFWSAVQERRKKSSRRLQTGLVAFACALVTALLLMVMTSSHSRSLIVCVSIVIFCALLMGGLVLLVFCRGVEDDFG